MDRTEVGSRVIVFRDTTKQSDHNVFVNLDVDKIERLEFLRPTNDKTLLIMSTEGVSIHIDKPRELLILIWEKLNEAQAIWANMNSKEV